MTGRVSAPWKKLSKCCGVGCGEMSTESASKHWWHSTQIIKFTICKYVFPKERERVPPKRKSMTTQEIVLPNLQQIQTAYSCFLRKAPLGLQWSSALSNRQCERRIAWQLLQTEITLTPIHMYLTMYAVVSCRNFLIRETTRLTILAEQLMEKIKNLWYTKVLGY